MSKVSNPLNMYFLLQVRNIMRIEEIAEQLEVSPRMVKEYKNDLQIDLHKAKKGGLDVGYFAAFSDRKESYEKANSNILALINEKKKRKRKTANFPCGTRGR